MLYIKVLHEKFLSPEKDYRYVSKKQLNMQEMEITGSKLYIL